MVKDFVLSHIGEMAALVTALCFTLNAVAYEIAGKKVGSLSVSYLRLFVAFFFVSLTAVLIRGRLLPLDASGHTWFWLLISGLVGFVLGDIFLFEAYVQIGSRISLLIMSLAPPIAALAGFLLMGEKIYSWNLLGMFLTMVGIGIVILSRSSKGNKIKLNRPVKGLVCASLGALGQAFGLLFSKYGMGSYDAIAATQIRLIAAMISFTIIISLRRKWPEIKEALNHKKALLAISIGAILGPFIGVTLALVALKYTATGIVSSISSISPVLIIPFSIIVFKEKVLPKEVLGAFVSIVGVILLFL